MLRRALAVLGLASTGLACSSSNSLISDAGTGSVWDGPPQVPHLTGLTVTGDSCIVLTPTFSPDVFDYYVRCQPGANGLNVSLTASKGAESALLLPMTSPPSPQQSLSVNVNENEAIVATATAGKTTTEYWVRCLPDDFPQLDMELHPAAGTPPPGYYLLGNSEPPAGHAGYAMVLDGNGVPVWYLGRAAGAGVGDVDAIVSGAITFVPTFATLPFEVRHLSPLSTGYASPSGTVLDTHELQVLPNGNYLALSNPIKSGVDLTGVRIGLPDGGVESFGKNTNINECKIVEFEPSGKVVWSWEATEHFDVAKDTVAPTIANEFTPTGGTIVDAFHCNSIDVDKANGNLLLSARALDTVLYIEKPSGKVLWKMGGFIASKDDATYVPVADPFYQQHDARIQSWSATCGRGQISVFDDHSDEPGPARGLVLDVVVGAADGGKADCGAPGPSMATDAWQYRAETNSSDRGSFRILADGSRIIGWGGSGTPGLGFTEVDEQGHDLLDFYFRDGNVSYRAIKVPLSAFDIGVLRRTAGLP